MKTRVISAAVLVPILFLIVLVAPVSAAAAILGMLLAIAAYELLYRTGLVKQPRLVIYSSVMAFVRVWVVTVTLPPLVWKHMAPMPASSITARETASIRT